MKRNLPPTEQMKLGMIGFPEDARIFLESLYRIAKVSKDPGERLRYWEQVVHKNEVLPGSRIAHNPVAFYEYHFLLKIGYKF